jgi:hypothetical protein
MYRRIVISCVALSLMALTSCNRNPVSSPDDDASATTINGDQAGSIAFATMSETSEVNEVLLTENPAPEDLFSQAILPETDLDQTLNKTASGTAVSLDTIDGVLRLAITSTQLAATHYDTIEAVLDETVFDDINDNESIIAVYGSVAYNSGMTTSYRVTETDGDGIINNDLSPQRATISFYSTTDLNSSSAVETYTVFDVGSGDDNDFDAEEDNILYRATWTQIKSGDTLAYAQFSDATGDGIAATSGAGTIDITFYRTAFPFRPLVEYRKIECTVKQNADGKKETVSFSAEEKYSTGRMNRLYVEDDDGNNIIIPNTMTHIYFTTNSPVVSDSEVTAQIHLVFDPGDNLLDETDNILHEATFEKSYRLGTIDSLNLHYTFSPAVAYGSEPESGSFKLETQFRNGKDAILEGTFDNGTIDATFTGPEGKITEVTVNK